MEKITGLKIAIIVLLFIFVVKLILKGWQKVAMARGGKRFRFLLIKSPFSREVSWRDVRYSVLVIIDSIISIVILIWVIDKLF